MQPKRDASMIFRSCEACQSPVYPIRDAIPGVRSVSPLPPNSREVGEVEGLKNEDYAPDSLRGLPRRRPSDAQE